MMWSSLFLTLVLVMTERNLIYCHIKYYISDVDLPCITYVAVSVHLMLGFNFFKSNAENGL